MFYILIFFSLWKCATEFIMGGIEAFKGIRLMEWFWLVCKVCYIYCYILVSLAITDVLIVTSGYR